MQVGPKRRVSVDNDITLVATKTGDRLEVRAICINCEE